MQHGGNVCVCSSVKNLMKKVIPLPVSYAFMHSDVLNCDRRAAFPTPGPPSISTLNVSTGPDCDTIKSSAACIGLIGARLLLLDLRRRNESPRFMTPENRN